MFVCFKEKHKTAIDDCTKAVELNPNYLKALLRRAELYEKTEKLDEALIDYQKVLEMDPGQHSAREACLVWMEFIIYSFFLVRYYLRFSTVFIEPKF